MLNGLRHRLLRMTARSIRTRAVAMQNEKPLVSFTFDDVPTSAYLNGAHILEDLGVRGTFYIAAGRCGQKDQVEDWEVILPEQVAQLSANGHEIGSHTFSHVN